MPNPNRDDDSGRYRETYPLEAFIDAIDAEGGFAGTQDVTNRVGCSYELAYKRLNQLEDDEQVTSRKVGNARLWQLVDEHDPADGPTATSVESAPDRPESGPEPEPGREPTSETEPTHSARATAESVVDAVAAGRVEGGERWDRDDRLEDRKAAAVAVLEHAIESGEHVGRSAAVEFHDEYPVDGQNTETWWRQNVRPVLAAVGDYSNGYHGYQIDRDRVDEIASSFE